jgi:hypothetical protein
VPRKAVRQHRTDAAAHGKNVELTTALEPRRAKRKQLDDRIIQLGIQITKRVGKTTNKKNKVNVELHLALKKTSLYDTL